ncbi:hypothetical protein [Algoriphagus namhaensis]
MCEETEGGCLVLDVWCGMWGVGCGVFEDRRWMSDVGCLVSGVGCRVSGVGCRVSGDWRLKTGDRRPKRGDGCLVSGDGCLMFEDRSWMSGVGCAVFKTEDGRRKLDVWCLETED